MAGAAGKNPEGRIQAKRRIDYENFREHGVQKRQVDNLRYLEITAWDLPLELRAIREQNFGRGIETVFVLDDIEFYVEVNGKKRIGHARGFAENGKVYIKVNNDYGNCVGVIYNAACTERVRNSVKCEFGRYQFGIAERRPEFVGAADDLESFIGKAVNNAFVRIDPALLHDIGSIGGNEAYSGSSVDFHPQITINTQKLTDAEMKRATDYISREFAKTVTGRKVGRLQ